MPYFLISAAVDMFSPENLAGYAATAVVAIIGFLITWFLLKKILYKPMMKVSDARKEAVSSGLRSNEEEKERLEKAKSALETDQEEALKKQQEQAEDARKTLALERETLVHDAHSKEDSIVANAQKNADQLLREQEERYRSDVIDMSLKVLAAVLHEKGNTEDSREEITAMVDTMLKKE